jgi:hypothetical protein
MLPTLKNNSAKREGSEALHSKPLVPTVNGEVPLLAAQPRRSAKRMKNIAAVCMIVVGLSGCGDTINGKGIAEPEVAKFHERLKAQDFEGMYKSGSDDFQAAAPKEEVIALFEAIDRKLGPLQETKQVTWNVNTQNLTTTVVLVYASKFREGDATETFTFRIGNQKPELIGYNIASLDMLIK